MLNVSLEILKSLSLQNPRSPNYPAPRVAKRCRSIITLKLSPLLKHLEEGDCFYDLFFIISRFSTVFCLSG